MFKLFVHFSDERPEEGGGWGVGDAWGWTLNRT